MNQRFLYLIFLLASVCFSFGQILPEPGAKLNYTQIMFEHPQLTGADEYLTQVTLDEKDFSFEHPVFISRDSSTATMISIFEFGKKYFWRYTGLKNGEELGWEGPYAFAILNDIHVDKKKYRVKVLENDSVSNTGGLILLDNLRTIVDRNGNFVWFLPEDTVTSRQAGKQSSPDIVIDDLRITPFGTVTLINGAKAEERDLKGNLLWQAPRRVISPGDSLKGDRPYNYSHCFKRLANGNYMVIDRSHSVKHASLEGGMGYSADASAGTDTGKIIVAYEIIREFDPKGKQVWSWNAENYFDTAELRRMIISKPDPGLRNTKPGGHMNAFDVDEKNGFVYAGFRNVSRIIKIDKKSGAVVCAWGANMTWRGVKNGDGFFTKQHETTLLHDGSIVVFNNNVEPVNVAGGPLPASSVMIFTQPSADTVSSVIWKFDCRFDSSGGLSIHAGSVDEMKNGNLLVCMGAINRVFEIRRDKHIVWNALIEKYDKTDSAWKSFPLYRAHYGSSLYPAYFTAQAMQKFVSNEHPAVEFRLFNVGTEDDSYDVKISSSSGHLKKEFYTDNLQSGKSALYKIAPDKSLSINDKIEVLIISKTNSDLVRKFFVQIRK